MTDIVERLRRVETAPLHGTEDWVELWEVLKDARAEIARLRISDAEREAISDAADRYAALTPESAETVATLRGLLERTK